MRPGGRSPFQVRTIEGRRSAQTIRDGTGDQPAQSEDRDVLSGAAAEFIDPAVGSVLTQSLVLGTIQTVISVSVNAMIALAAGSIALFLGTRPTWLLVQRWLMGTVLAGLAVRLALEARRA